MSGTSNSSGPKTKLSRRKFLLGSAATAASAAVTVNSERADAFFNTFGFMKKSAGSGQTSNGYAIGQSLRFNSAASTYFSYVFKAGGNPNTFTLSLWLKRSQINGASGGAELFSTAAGGGFDFGFGASTWSIVDKIGVLIGSGTCYKNTNTLVRDPSAWYHVVISCNSGSYPNGIRIYVNGFEDTGSYIANNPGTWAAWNSNGGTAYLGKPSAFSNYFDGFIADVYLIDGQALGPSSFGQSDTITGQWIPLAYTGTYGTNGCYLKFADSANLGQDSSGNGNNWTPNNFQTHDQVLDSPTNNFCTWNPLTYRLFGSNFGSMTWTGGSLSVNGVSLQAATGGMGVTSGKWYYEATLTYTSLGGNFNSSGEFGLVDDAGNYWLYYGGGGTANGTIYANASTVSSIVSPFTLGDIIGVSIDLTASPSYAFYKNGSLVGSYSFSPSGPILPFASYGSGSGSAINWTSTFNFGQGGQTGLVYDAASGGRFKHTPPVGFKALCTANLPAPAIKKPSDYFNAMTWSGDGASTRTITGLSLTPDLVWIKNRSTTLAHTIYDAVRGYGPSKGLGSNSTTAEGLGASNEGYLNAVNTAALDLAKGTDPNSYTNLSGHNYVAWCWKANATGSKGTYIAERYNASSGLSIISYAGNSTARVVPHSLNAVPRLIIVKNRTNTGGIGWHVYHSSADTSPQGYYLRFDTGSKTASANIWNNTAPTDQNFSIGGANDAVNLSGDSYIAYLWAEVAGFSKFGSYTGNGSADGPFVYCGFKPRWIMWKRSDSTGSWHLHDSTREVYNGNPLDLLANTAGAESSGVYPFDFLSNGFKVRSNDAEANGTNATYIFAAFAEAPFKYATAK